MIEIRIHGRGGQGNVVAAYLLAAAAVREGLYAQAFPAFGAERRGAPVAAFVRCGENVILRRCRVECPDAVIVQDASLLGEPATLEGLTEGGAVLFNSGREPWRGMAERDGLRWAGLPATAISEEAIGRPVPNTPLLAAFAALTGLVSLEALSEAIDRRFGPEKGSLNRRAVEAAGASVPAGAWEDLGREARH